MEMSLDLVFIREALVWVFFLWNIPFWFIVII